LGCFDIFCEGNGVVQAVKHKERPIYGVLFHPEVRNKNLILEFLKSARHE
jgi:GMP synthase (glutamine-hydrolysing)